MWYAVIVFVTGCAGLFLGHALARWGAQSRIEEAREREQHYKAEADHWHLQWHKEAKGGPPPPA